MYNRKKLNNVTYDGISLPKSKIFLNLNLSPPFKELDYFCRKLKRECKMISMVTSHAFVKVNLLNKSLKKITHMNDLKSIFPDYDFN